MAVLSQLIPPSRPRVFMREASPIVPSVSHNGTERIAGSASAWRLGPLQQTLGRKVVVETHIPDGNSARRTSERDDARHTGLDPDDTDLTKARRGGHAYQWQGQAVEGVRRINDPDRLAGEVGESERGSVLAAF